MTLAKWAHASVVTVVLPVILMGFRPFSQTERDVFERVQGFLPGGGFDTYFTSLLTQETVQGSIGSHHSIWADMSWKTLDGELAYRYRSQTKFRDTYRKYFPDQRQPTSAPLLEALNWSEEQIERRLSPAEKYDLAVGDVNATLTREYLSRSYNYMAQHQVGGAWGVCEGSAGAAIYFAEPTRQVRIVSPLTSTEHPNGVPVVFNGADIKGLMSGLFSRYNLQDDRRPVLGRKCATSNPDRGRDGAINDSDCFDTNPGVFFLMLLNYMGKKGETFVVDANGTRSERHHVWNLPVARYEIKKIFNPDTGDRLKIKRSSDIRKANWRDLMATPRQWGDDDRYRARRSPGTAFIVGMEIDVWYYGRDTAGVNGSHERSTFKHSYEFDLELSSNREVIGGEWRRGSDDVPPDFIWAIPGAWQGENDAPEFYPWSTGELFEVTTIGRPVDQFLEAELDSNGRIPELLRNIAIQTSSARAQPVFSIVALLANRSI